jgi:pimeloyl-ACP methyl ester carboxylesterase
MPLLLAHGWPDSFWRYSEVVPLLVDPGAHGGDPADAFDVVVPDMPGYGYSDRPPQTLDEIEVARLWARLMDRLGYPRFAAAGGDIGSGVVHWLALDYPERIAAIHLTDAVFTTDFDRETLTAEERDWLGQLDRWEREEGAYQAMHATKPQTAAVGLTDSPAGLAAWLIEKLRAWSGRRPDGTSLLDRDAMLTDVTIYWLTGTIGSSMRMYRANEAIPRRNAPEPSGYQPATCSSRPTSSRRRRTRGSSAPPPTSYTSAGPRAPDTSRRSRTRSCTQESSVSSSGPTA